MSDSTRQGTRAHSLQVPKEIRQEPFFGLNFLGCGAGAGGGKGFRVMIMVFRSLRLFKSWPKTLEVPRVQELEKPPTNQIPVIPCPPTIRNQMLNDLELSLLVQLQTL